MISYALISYTRQQETNRHGTTAAATSAPTSDTTTAAPVAKAAVDAGVQVAPNKMGILIAFLALFFIH